MTKATFDKLSFFYNILEKYIFREYETIKDIINRYVNLKENSKIIDIGGGTGLNTECIADRGYDVTLIDFSRNMLLKADYSKFSLIWGNGTCLPIKNDSYDVSLLINSLHHIDNKLHQDFIDESFRILKSGGKIYIIDIFPYDPDSAERIKRPIVKIINFLLFNKLTLLYFKIEKLVHGNSFHQNPPVIESMIKNSGFKDFQTIQPVNSNSKYVVTGTK